MAKIQIEKFEAVKDPEDRLDYTFNFAPMRLADDETVTEATVTFVPTGVGHLTLEAVECHGKKVVAMIGGGQPKTNYVVTCEATTSKGKIINRAAILPVADK